ncbi:MAG: glycerol kinase GlpK [Alphaproteobacteria bacterium]
MTYILSVDQGTSSSRAILFNDKGEIQTVFQKELELTYPQDGWVEQNPQDIVDDTVWAVDCILKDERFKGKIAAVGITNQRETTILWDRNTGEPVYNAIVWQDRRTAAYCKALKGDGVEPRIRQKTGLLLDPYFSATKIKWVLDNVEGARVRAENGELLFGTIDCFLLWHLTGGRVHATDETNASRTMLYNINAREWDRELLDIFDVPECILPDVRENVSDYSQLDSRLFGYSIPIGGMAGDQQAALVGQGCISPGMSKATYGTGCFVLMNVGDTPVLSGNHLLGTIGFSCGGNISYALEGSIFNAGTAIQFLRDNFGFIESAKDSEEMASMLPDNGGVYFVPAFTGLGAPYWKSEARGVIYGLSRDTSKAHVVRAALEAQGYQTRDLIGAMQADSNRIVDVLRIDGGLVANGFVCQFIADMLNVPVQVPKVHESTAWGAACLAGVQVGVFDSLEDATSRWQCAHDYIPRNNVGNNLEKLYSMWKSTVEKSY